MANVKGLEAVLRALRERAARAMNDTATEVVVGYTAAYAIYVHENLEAHHPVGQAKFLEQPARENRGRYAGIVKEALAKGKTLGQALLLAGLALQRDSQQLCPVDTGNMKNSAFTRVE